MGKRGKQNLSLDEYSDKLFTLADANGYEPGRHRDEDGERNKFNYAQKSVKHHDSSLRRYLAWRFRQMKIENDSRGLPTPKSADVEALWLGKGTPAPHLVDLKDFMRFWAKTSKPRIVEKPTVVSGESFAKNLFTGFKKRTGTPISDEDSEEVYYWIRNTLMDEGLVIDVTKEKYLFTKFDLINILRSFWCADDPIYISERYRIQFQFIFLVYNWTGARVGTFFNGSLLYKHITLAIQRMPGGWRLIYQLDQHWVKGNRSPEHIAYGIAGSGHPVLTFDETAPFLALALADNAIRDVKTLDDLRQIRLKPGEDFRRLKFNKEVENLPILRKFESGCVTEKPMPKHAFVQILDETAKKAGYTWPITIHAIRRALGKKVDERYTEVQRSQHLVQSDTRVFGQSYVGKVSSVNGRAAVLEEVADHSFIEYFQGLRRFWEPGFPCELPAEKLDALENDVELLAMKARKLSLEAENAPVRVKKQAENDLSRFRTSQRRKALEQFQEGWLDQSIDERDSSRAGKTEVLDILSCLVPERARLAQWIASDKPLPEDESWQAIEDMYSLLKWEEESPVLYLPGHQPINRRCPRETCQAELERIPKRDRNRHIHDCKRKALVEQSHCLQTQVRYCYYCYTWCIGDEEWDRHCQRHLYTLSSKLCGSVTYRHTLLRPAVCPFSLSTKSATPEELKTFKRDEKWWAHVNEHLVQCRWPCLCPHPLCDTYFANSDSLKYHFIDHHGASRAGSPGKRKAAAAKLAEHSYKPFPRPTPSSLQASFQQESISGPIEQTICPQELSRSGIGCQSSCTLSDSTTLCDSSDSSTVVSNIEDAIITPKEDDTNRMHGELHDDQQSQKFCDDLFAEFVSLPPSPGKISDIGPPSTEAVSTSPAPAILDGARSSEGQEQPEIEQQQDAPQPRILLRLKPPREPSVPRLILRVKKIPQKGAKGRRGQKCPLASLSRDGEPNHIQNLTVDLRL